MRRIDKLGRVVIPMELRQKYGLSDGVRIEFVDTGDGVAVRPCEPLCKLCRGVIGEGTTLPLCDACMAQAAKEYQERR